LVLLLLLLLLLLFTTLPTTFTENYYNPHTFLSGPSLPLYLYLWFHFFPVEIVAAVVNPKNNNNIKHLAGNNSISAFVGSEVVAFCQQPRILRALSTATKAVPD